MSALPERYRPYANQAAGQPHQPTAIYQPQPIDRYEERPPIAWVADPYNPARSVAVDARLIQRSEPAPPRDLTPQPLLDPVAQRWLGAGVGVGAAGAGVGWGLGQLAAGIALMGTAGVAILAGLLLAAASMRGRSITNIHNEAHTHVTQKWLGRANVTNQQ
ncbi:hypothetical protein [Streptomyces sp. NPDC093598]|uniref:hypothetical protein n=1 Tax=Streptomyces sp. NPDC093598 TaxID=3366046 RepID=UPI003818CEA0